MYIISPTEFIPHYMINYPLQSDIPPDYFKLLTH